jgi:hypothetical protein
VFHSNNTIEPWLQPGLVRAIRRIVAGADPGALTAPATEPLRKEEYPALAGRWRMADGEVLEIDSAGTRVWMRRQGVRYEIFPVSSTTFYAPGLHFMIGFARNSGSIARIHVATVLSEAWGAR